VKFAKQKLGNMFTASYNRNLYNFLFTSHQWTTAIKN